MKTFEDFGVSLGGASQPQANGDALEEAVTAYTNLGLLTDEGRAREAFGQIIEARTASFSEAVTSQPRDLVLAPKLGELSFDGLKARYDQLTGQHGNPATYVWDSLWSQYSDEELNQGQIAPIEAYGVLLGGENDYDEAGLYFTDQNLKQQRKSVEKAKKDYNSDDTQLRSMSIATYMVRNAMLLERGEQLMDQPTYIRFIGLDKKRGGGSCVPGADSSGDGRVVLRGSDDGAGSRGGVRLSVGPKA
jgi:hypothetical protein